MQGTSVASHGIVREVLTRCNYEEWKTLMKNYLKGENLWDVVVGSDSASTERDAKALHIIQLSCGPKIFHEIKQFETSVEAWKHLAAVYGSDQFKAEPHPRHGVVSDTVSDLYKFVEKGDWRGASSCMREESSAIFWAPASGRTVLHVATLGGHLKIVEGLVNLGKEKLVEMQDKDGYTALALAAGYTGYIDIAKCIVNGKGGEKVLDIENKNGEIPLLLAADSGHKRMTRFLFFRSSHILKHQSSRNRVLLLERCIQAHIFDVALRMLKSEPGLPDESFQYGFGGLHELARMPSAFLNATPSETLQAVVYNMTDGTLVDILLMILRLVGKLLGLIIRGLCESTRVGENIRNEFLQIYEETIFGHSKNEVLQILSYYKDSVAKLGSSQLREVSVYDAMLDAAKHGNVEFINAMREANDDLLRAMDNQGRGIFSYAVLHRKQNVFQLMRTLMGNKDVINYRTDMFGNNLLHLAAHLGPFSDLSLRPGAALQMQREIQWFKAVEEIVHLKCREARNDEGKKPGEIFIERHRELMSDGEKWAKETAGTFAIVGVLVITVMFAAIFTVPGGYNQETGVPIFINEKTFTMFVVADVISLFASIVVVLIYVDIQTSRYAETDFLKRLPTKIMSGLGFLSLSLVSMMVAFCAALDIVLHKSCMYKEIFTAVVIFAGLPFTLLVPSQVRLLLEIFRFITSNPITGHQKPTNQDIVGRIFHDLWLIIKGLQ